MSQERVRVLLHPGRQLPGLRGHGEYVLPHPRPLSRGMAGAAPRDRLVVRRLPPRRTPERRGALLAWSATTPTAGHVLASAEIGAGGGRWSLPTWVSNRAQRAV